ELAGEVRCRATPVGDIDHGLSVLGRQATEGFFDDPRSQQLVDLVLYRTVGFRGRWHGGPLTRGIDDDVAQNCEQPRSLRTERRIESTSGPPGADEGLLHGVLGESAVAERPL